MPASRSRPDPQRPIRVAIGILNLAGAVPALLHGAGQAARGGAATQLAVLRLAAGGALIAGGVQLLRRRESGRWLSLGFALSWLALNAAEAALDGPSAALAVASIYPVVLLALLGRPRVSPGSRGTGEEEP
jgi:hypothetical protein